MAEIMTKLGTLAKKPAVWIALLCILFIAIHPSVSIVWTPQSPLLTPPPVDFVKDVLDSEHNDYCNPRGQIQDTCCDFQSVEDIQGDTYDKIQALVRTKFFKYYKLNLYRECPFWNDDGLCMNRDCSVQTVDEALLPESWRQEALSALQTSPKGGMLLPFKVCTFKDQDFCLLEDNTDNDVVYVNLLDNPERFTGYAGESAGRVWKAIYEENCFNIVHKMTENCDTCNNIMNTGQQQSPANPFEALHESKRHPDFAAVPNSKAQFNQLLDDLAETPDGSAGGEEVCLEKRVYYRLISGLHSSISIHICDEWFNQTSGAWVSNLDCFVNRIGSHPERLQNIYFTYALALRAVTKLESYFDHYDFVPGDDTQNNQIRSMVKDLIQSATACPMTFDEKTMFKGPDARGLYLEFRDHFRNVSRIMDCVGCEKCRLWGKIQTTGLGTALKVLFAYEDHQISSQNLLQRGEIVALFNTFNRLSESLRAIQKFRAMYQQQMSGAIEPSGTTIDLIKKAAHDVALQAKQCLQRLCSVALKALKRWNIPRPAFIDTFLESLA